MGDPSEMQYIRFDENYGNYKLIPITESPYKHIKRPNLPHFISMMKYNHSQFLEWQKTKSLKGMNGSTTNRIWVDFDSKDNLELAFDDCIKFVERLQNLGFKEEEIQISFSGGKGTGVIVETNSEFTISEVKNLCAELAKDLKTFDTSMYDHQRIFRLLFTKNEKTGLYKIPLSLDQLKEKNIGNIKEEAKDLNNFDQDYVLNYYKRSSVVIPKELLVAKEEQKKKIPLINSDIKPRHWKEYKWQILQGNFEKGERHNALMVLAATCRGLGYDSVTATAMCNVSDEKHCKLTQDIPVTELDRIIDDVFGENWKGGQYSPANNLWLKTYCERLGIKEDDTQGLTKIIDAKEGFINFVKHIDENTIKTGIECLDNMMPLTTGMICGAVAAASAGKTAWAIKVLKNTSATNVTSVFASLDMHRTRLFEKLIYSETGMNRDFLYSQVKDNKSQDVFDKIEKNFENVYFYDRSSATVGNIRKYIEHVQETTGKKVKLLMVDYFERVGAEKSDDTAASKEVAGQLQDLCNDLNLCIVVLVQPNKFSLGGGPDSPILSYTAIKGSSFLYQSFRSIISMWRPFFTPEDTKNDKYLQMAILKNDLGEIGQFTFSWNGKRGDIQEFKSEEELDEFKRLLKEKQDRKQGEKQENGSWP